MTPNSPLIERIQKLLALASNNPNQHEAALAASRVQELLTEHQLSMAEVEASSTQKKGLSEVSGGIRLKTQSNKSAMYLYQRQLMETIAKNNFTMWWVQETWKDDPKGKDGRRKVKTHMLIGREENVVATQMVYDYLVTAMDSLLPFQQMSKRGKDALLWLDGCGERLRERLDDQRQKKEEETRRAQAAHPQQHGLILLRDVYDDEELNNEDVRWGRPPGTSVRERAEAVLKRQKEKAEEDRLVEMGHSPDDAWYLARGMKVPEKVAVEVHVKQETDAQRRKREASDQAYWRREREKRYRKEAKEEARRNQPAFRSGRLTGDEIGLSDQVKSGSKKEIA